LWKNIKNDFDNLILQTRKQLNDIENEEKKSRNLNEENRVKKTKQMILRKWQQLLKTEFHAIQRLWYSTFKFLTWKIKHVNFCNLKCWTYVELFIIQVNDYFYDNFYDNLFKIKSIFNKNKFFYFYNNLFLSFNILTKKINLFHAIFSYLLYKKKTSRVTKLNVMKYINRLCRIIKIDILMIKWLRLSRARIKNKCEFWECFWNRRHDINKSRWHVSRIFSIIFFWEYFDLVFKIHDEKCVF
jgi:hypothetical protein